MRTILWYTTYCRLPISASTRYGRLPFLWLQHRYCMSYCTSILDYCIYFFSLFSNSLDLKAQFSEFEFLLLLNYIFRYLRDNQVQGERSSRTHYCTLTFAKYNISASQRSSLCSSASLSSNFLQLILPLYKDSRSITYTQDVFKKSLPWLRKSHLDGLRAARRKRPTRSHGRRPMRKLEEGKRVPLRCK